MPSACTRKAEIALGGLLVVLGGQKKSPAGEDGVKVQRHIKGTPD
jgi:hypothetical protein